MAQMHAIAQALDDTQPGAHNAGLLRRASAALRAASREPPPPDNTVRDIMAHEAARAMRTDRERLIAKSEINDDDQFIRDLAKAGDRDKIAKLISLTARFAGELQHNLIHPSVRYKWKACSPSDTVALIQGLPSSWDAIVDPGLAGNARIACKNIADAHHPRLRGLTVDMILAIEDESLLDFFCAAIAARWRANSVFAAGPYKTGNEQQAVLHALNEAMSLFRDYTVAGGLLHKDDTRRPPTSLAELRGMGGPFLRDY